jgi:hypothetical protein
MEIAEAVSKGTADAILNIEHLCAKSLKQAIRDAGELLVSVYSHLNCSLQLEKNWQKR